MSSFVDCIACIVNKTEKLAEKHSADKMQKFSVMKQILREISDTEFEKSPPYVDSRAARILKREFGIEDLYLDEKRYFNEKLLAMETEIESLLNSSKDRFADTLKIALAGNIMDFSALPNLDFELVKRIIEETRSKDINPDALSQLRADLANGSNLLYLGDNAGEIVLDKVFIKEIRREYPRLNIRFATRGAPIYNDITVDDAHFVGMDRYASIISNGSDIPGTDLDEVSSEFHDAFMNADIILSKGQGNFESLLGCGRNVYYLFLCKCNVFIKKMGAKQFDSMFINELRI